MPKNPYSGILIAIGFIIGIVIVVNLILEGKAPSSGTSGQTISFIEKQANVLIEPLIRQCNDGIDNDKDRLIDFPKDPDCLDGFDDFEETNDECFDTDGGFFIERSGFVYGVKDGELFEISDECFDGKLREYVCVGKNFDFAEVDCKNSELSNCKDEKCI